MNNQIHTIITAPLVEQGKLARSYAIINIPAVYVDCRLLYDLSVESFARLTAQCMNISVSSNESLPQITNALAKTRKNHLSFSFYNLQLITPILDIVLFWLESLCFQCVYASDTTFITTSNLYCERIYKSIKSAPYILDSVSYVPLDASLVTEINSARLWNSLSELQKRALRLIITGEKEIPNEVESDMVYLEKTGIIKQKRDNYLLSVPYLNKQAVATYPQSITIGGNTIYAGEEEISSKLSIREQQVLMFLIKRKGSIVSREQIAKALWKKKAFDTYSEWAIDKAMARIRAKLSLCLLDSNCIKTHKRKGFSFINVSKKDQNTSRNYNVNGLNFKQIVYTKQTISFYQNTFNDPKIRQFLYHTTPKVDSDIRSWLQSITHTNECFYFHIIKKDKIIGHIGLDSIDSYTQSARLGMFYVSHKYRVYAVQSAIRFILHYAKSETPLRYLYCDVAGNEVKQIEALERAGFKKKVGQENVLFYKIG